MGTSTSHTHILLDLFIQELVNKNKIPAENLITILDSIKNQYKRKSSSIPNSIFKNKKLTILEAIVKYLKEEKKLKFTEIGKLLYRDYRVIWKIYSNASKKLKEKLDISDYTYPIPLSIFKERRLSALESVVKFLKENYNLRYHQIAKLLNRDDRTIWTVYNKSIKKMQIEKK